MKIQGNKGAAIFGILTIIPEEFEAVSNIFAAAQNILGTQYFVEDIANPGAGKKPEYDVVILQAPGQTNLTASDVVRDLIEDFRPEYVLLVGIAGGHSKRDVKVGDVVIADFVEDSEYFKLSEGKVLQRKRPYDHPSYRLRNLYAEPLCKSDSWHKHIKAKRPLSGKPRALIANLASGDKLLGDRKNIYQKTLVQHFEKASVFEMEGFGVASQIYKSRGSPFYNPQYLIIRAVSDLVNESGNQAKRDKWKKYAASAAAAFTKELVSAVLRTRAELASQ